MDRSDNPGMVERELDETPVEREGMTGGSGTEREGMQGGGRVEREGLQDEGTDRQGMDGADGTGREDLQGGAVERDNLVAGEHGDTRQGMSGAGGSHTAGDQQVQENREGGYGDDRPADIQRASDREGGASRGMDGRQTTERGRGMGEDRQAQPGTMNRDW